MLMNDPALVIVAVLNPTELTGERVLPTLQTFHFTDDLLAFGVKSIFCESLRTLG